MSEWDDWIGGTKEQSDLLDAQRAQAMQASLGLEGPPLADGEPLPPLWHWLYFWEVVPPAGLGADGHAKRGGFLPPIPLPRRMWAGGRLSFRAPLKLGERATRRSTISSIVEKQGSTGKLAFVTVEHRIGDALVEEHDIVYREAGHQGAAVIKTGPEAPTDCDWRVSKRADPVLLFRYSALTFNGHRVHYDLDYVRKMEHYPGLLVHGPLMATMLLGEAARAEGAGPRGFSFRVLAPVFHGEAFDLCGRRGETGGLDLWIEKAGRVCISAEAHFDERSAGT